MMWPEHCGLRMVYLGDQDIFLGHKPKTPRPSPEIEAHYYCEVCMGRFRLEFKIKNPDGT